MNHTQDGRGTLRFHTIRGRPIYIQYISHAAAKPQESRVIKCGHRTEENKFGHFITEYR